MLSSACFKQPSVHHQEELYMQLCDILSCSYISSLVAVRMYLIQIHPDSDQCFGTHCPIFMGGTFSAYKDGTEYGVWLTSYLWSLKVTI
jgi:hypothetical protein